MSLLLEAQRVPLITDDDGVVRVGGTRVTLETVVAAFREGLTAEEIVDQYPSLRLPDVYLVIGYVLNHPDYVNSYISKFEQQSAEVRRENERRFDPAGIRDRLLARRKQG